MTPETCAFAHLDGAYVLGSLAPDERQEYEAHLRTCDHCSAAIRDLAGLPGLLGRVDPAVLESDETHEPLPETLLPRVLADVRRRDRHRWRLAAGAVAAAASVTVGAVVWTQSGGDGSVTPVVTARAQQMIALHHAPLAATVALQQVPWGTRLDLSCTYSPDSTLGMPWAVTYVLVVRTKDGSLQRLGTWRSIEGRTTTFTSGTSVDASRIASVEVRTTDGLPVLELTTT